MKRIMAIILSALMLTGLCAAASPGVYAEEKTEYIFSDSFEDYEDGKLPGNGWSVIKGSGTEGIVTSEAANNGKKSYYSTNNSGLRSKNIPVTSGSYYKVSADAIISEGSAQLYVEFWKGNSRLTPVEILTFSGYDWSTATTTVRAVDGAEYMTVLLYQSDGNVGAVNYDNVLVSVGKDPTTTDITMKQLVTGYPRLFFTAAEADSVKAKKDDKTPNYANTTNQSVCSYIISTADAYLKENSFACSYYNGYQVTYDLPLKQPGPRENPPEYGHSGQYPYWTGLGGAIKARIQYPAMAYFLTGDEKYARLATDYCMWLTEWTSWSDPTYGDGLACLDSGYITMGVCTAYDLLYDYFTDEERSAIKEAIYKYSIINQLKVWNLTIDHNVQMVITSSMAAAGCLLLGEYPEANAAVVKALEYFKVFLDRRVSTESHEGTGYTSLTIEYMMTAVDIINRVTGDTSIIDHEYLNEFLFKWLVAAGDSSNGIFPVISDTSEGAGFFVTASIISKLTNNPLAGYYLTRAKVYSASLEGLIYCINDPVSAVPGQDLQSVNIKGAGWGAMRTGWNAGDTLFVFSCSKSAMGHNHPDNNSFDILRNGVALATDPGYEDYSPGDNANYTYYDGHSTIYVDGKHQNTPGYCTISEKLTSGYFAYMIGNASKAYINPKLSKFNRSFQMINHPGFAYFVVKDDIEAPESHEYTWRLNVSNAIFTRVEGKSIKRDQANTGKRFECEFDDALMNVVFATDNPLNMTWYQYAGKYGLLMDVSTGESSAKEDYLALISVSTAPNTTLYFYPQYDNITLSNPESTCSIARMDAEQMLFFKPKATGDYMTVPVTIGTTGVYNMTLHMARARSYGSCDIYLDDTLLTEYDGYLDDYLYFNKVKLENILITSGQHMMKFVSKGSSGNAESFNIGAILMKLEAVDPDIGKVKISENIDTDAVRGFKASYGGEYGSNDLVLFSKETGISSNGVETDGGYAAVLGIKDNSLPTLGYVVTEGKSLVYNGKTLYESNSPSSAAFTFESDEGSVIDCAKGGTIKLYVPTDSLKYKLIGLKLNGETAQYTVDENNVMTFTVADGKTYVDFVYDKPVSDGEKPGDDKPETTPDNGNLKWIIIGSVAVIAVIAAVLSVIAHKKKKSK